MRQDDLSLLSTDDGSWRVSILGIEDHDFRIAFALTTLRTYARLTAELVEHRGMPHRSTGVSDERLIGERRESVFDEQGYQRRLRQRR